jgi:hypothetical protein
MAVRVTAKDFPRVLRARLAKDTEVVRRAAIEVTARGVAEAVAETDRQGLVDQSQYRQSWKFYPLDAGAELRNDAPYAGVIEYGRRPNRPGPPFQPIYEWVKRKLGGTGAIPTDALVTNSRGDVIDPAVGIAWAIRNAIHKKGSKPRFVLRSVFGKMRPWFGEAVKRALKRRRTTASVGGGGPKPPDNRKRDNKGRFIKKGG